MKNPGRTILYGVLIWAAVFAVSFIVYPFKKEGSPLFETIITIALTFFTVLASFNYLIKEHHDYGVTSIVAGFSWMVINILIDIPLFSYGPMKMSFISYLEDIGLTYLAIPVIVIGMGRLLDKKTKLK